MVHIIWLPKNWFLNVSYDFSSDILTYLFLKPIVRYAPYFDIPIFPTNRYHMSYISFFKLIERLNIYWNTHIIQFHYLNVKIFTTKRLIYKTSGPIIEARVENTLIMQLLFLLRCKPNNSLLLVHIHRIEHGVLWIRP